MPLIVKGDGTREPFKIEKLIASLAHCDVDEGVTKKVAEHVAAEVKENMTTTDIYQHAFALLRREERVFAARYSMRRAILDLGPTGFPFEDYIGELMRAKGYATKTRVILQGKCTTHEVDVVLEKDGKRYGAELKFHNAPGFKTDVKTALYVRARFTDIESRSHEKGEKCPVDGGWLVTNTKFTSNALEYSECAGITLLGWNYPLGKGLADIIRETRVYPITILTTLSKGEKARLLQNGTTLCSMISKNPSTLERAGITGPKIQQVLSESAGVCKP